MLNIEYTIFPCIIQLMNMASNNFIELFRLSTTIIYLSSSLTDFNLSTTNSVKGNENIHFYSQLTPCQYPDSPIIRYEYHF